MVASAFHAVNKRSAVYYVTYGGYNVDIDMHSMTVVGSVNCGTLVISWFTMKFIGEGYKAKVCVNTEFISSFSV